MAPAVFTFLKRRSPDPFRLIILDRTNVVQSALAKYIIDKQLRSAGVLAPNDTVENHPEFMWIFRNGQPPPPHTLRRLSESLADPSLRCLMSSVGGPR